MFSASVMKSQGYIPFPEPGLRQGAWYSGNVYQSPQDHSVSFKYTGDTLFNSYTYAKLCVQDWFHNTVCQSPFPSYTRFDSGKIYYRSSLDTSSTETLLYDFTLTPGQSFFVFHGFSASQRTVVQRTRVTTADNLQRWRIAFNGTSPADSVVWIEGIGDMDMGFFVAGDYEGGSSKFICQYTSMGLTYANPNPPLACDSMFAADVSGIDELSRRQLQVYPNPFDKQLSFKLMGNDEVLFTLYDVFGRQISRQDFISSTTINTVNLAAGIYFYEVRNKQGSVENGKVIKH